MNRCDQCRFFHQSNGLQKDNETGYCRINPPGSLYTGIGIVTKFPVVSIEDWCGKWEKQWTSY